MSGDRYLLDTNAVIQLFDGNCDIARILNRADFVAMSVISEFEYLSYDGLNEKDVLEYNAFRDTIQVFNVPSDDPTFTQLVVNARKDHGMKLPDAIIAATARANNLSVLTSDDHFKKLKAPWKVRFYATASV